MNIGNTIHVLGFTKNQDAMYRTCAEVERIGFKPIPFWNFPTPYTKYLQNVLPNMNKPMRSCPSFFNSGWGHYSILCVARDLGEVPVFVVEDDCRFLNDVDTLHSALAKIPEDADLVLLDSFGAHDNQDEFKRWRSLAKDGWAKVEAARSAAAYIVGPRAIDRLINLGDRGTRGKRVRIFDQWFEERWLVGMNIYCAVPNLAIQRGTEDANASRISAGSNLRKYIEMGLDLSSYAAW